MIILEPGRIACKIVWNWAWKMIQNWFGDALIRFIVGLQNLRKPLQKAGTKLPITTCLLVFSPASASLYDCFLLLVLIDALWWFSLLWWLLRAVADTLVLVRRNSISQTLTAKKYGVHPFGKQVLNTRPYSGIFWHFPTRKPKVFPSFSSRRICRALSVKGKTKYEQDIFPVFTVW